MLGKERNVLMDRKLMTEIQHKQQQQYLTLQSQTKTIPSQKQQQQQQQQENNGKTRTSKRKQKERLQELHDRHGYQEELDETQQEIKDGLMELPTDGANTMVDPHEMEM